MAPTVRIVRDPAIPQGTHPFQKPTCKLSIGYDASHTHFLLANVTTIVIELLEISLCV